jgi:serine/threonine protein kinase
MLCSSCSTPLPTGALFCVACGFKNDAPPKPSEEKILLDRYSLDTVISKGPFSTVYRGKDNRLGRSITLKVQNVERTNDPSIALHLQREAYISAILPHPFTATLYSSETLKDGRILLIMELLEGENLAERIVRSGVFSIEETAAITSLMCGVLAYFHQHKFVFGNLSLENVVLTPVPFEPEPLPKLCSFGVAAELSANLEQLPDWLQGKSAFIEEQQREFNLAQDIHSLAVFAYQLHTGHMPPEEITEALHETPFLSMLEKVIYQQKTFESALLFKDALIEAVSAAPTEAHTEEPLHEEASSQEVEAAPQEKSTPEEPPHEEAPPEELESTRLEDPSQVVSSLEEPKEEIQEPSGKVQGEATKAKDEPNTLTTPTTLTDSTPKITSEEPSDVYRDSEKFSLLSEEPSFEGEMPNLNEVLLQLEQVAIAPPSYENLLSKAHRLFQQKNYDEAFSAYQEILAASYEEQSEEDLALILYHLGTIRRETGSEEKAQIFYQKAHDLAPENKDILRDLLALFEKKEDWEHFVYYQERYVPLLEGELRQKALVALGQALQEHMQDYDRAEEYLTQALSIDPSHWGNVRHLFMLHFESKQWAKSANTLQRLASLTADPSKRTSLYYSLAGIFYDELQQAPQALQALNMALDDSWANHKALQKIEAILLQRREYAALAESYERMIQRIPERQEPALRASLYHKLGEVYRDKLNANDLAANCFEQAIALDPSQEEAMMSLTDIYATDTSQGAKAISFHRKKIEQAPDDTESLHTLWRLYLQQEQFDKAFCVSAVLVFTQQNTAEERGFYEQHRSKSLLTAQRILDSEMFDDQIKSTKEDRYISGIFRLLSPYVANLYSQKEKNLGLKPKDKIDLSKPELMLPKRFLYVAKILNVAGISLYSQENRDGFEYELVSQEKGGYKAVATVGVDLLSGRTDKEIVFLCGKHLSYLRPEYFLVRALKTSYGTLRVVLFAAISMISPQAIPSSIEEILVIQQLASKLEQVVPGNVLDQLEKIVMEALSSGRRLSVSEWMNQVEIAANRVGFLLSNDLEASYRAISSEKSRLSPLQNSDKIQDLARFSIQEEYFKLRKHFGFAL